MVALRICLLCPIGEIGNGVCFTLLGKRRDPRRRIGVVADVEDLSERGEDTLSKSEKTALDIYQNALKAFQDKYRKKVKQAMQRFILTVKEALSDISPGSTKETNDQFNAMILLDERISK